MADQDHSNGPTPQPLMGDGFRGRSRGRGGFRGRGGGDGGGHGRGNFRGGRGAGNFRGRGGGDFRAPQSGGKNHGREGGEYHGHGGEPGSGEQRGRGGFRGRGGMGQSWNPDERLNEKLLAIGGPTFDLPSSEDQERKKFTNKCRLFVGNLTDDTTMEEFQEMFSTFGEISEPYINLEKAFGFIKLDYRENAEKARCALNGTQRCGRVLKVRFSAVGCALKVKRLSPWISNELLHLAFSVFGELERAVVVTDERGKSTGTGIVEFSKKPSALHCLRRCSETSFFLTQSVQPVEVEPLVEEDVTEGLSDQMLPKKNHDYMRQRSVGPRMATSGSFEQEYGNRWKQLYELEKQRRHQLDQEMRLEVEKLQDQMELARRQHETELLREQLRQRELEQQRSKDSWEARQQHHEAERRRREEQIQMRQQMMHGGGQQAEQHQQPQHMQVKPEPECVPSPWAQRQQAAPAGEVLYNPYGSPPPGTPAGGAHSGNAQELEAMVAVQRSGAPPPGYLATEQQQAELVKRPRLF